MQIFNLSACMLALDRLLMTVMVTMARDLKIFEIAKKMQEAEAEDDDELNRQPDLRGGSTSSITFARTSEAKTFRVTTLVRMKPLLVLHLLTKSPLVPVWGQKLRQPTRQLMPMNPTLPTGRASQGRVEALRRPMKVIPSVLDSF